MGKRNKNGMFATARRQFEQELVMRVVAECKGNKTEAAKVLGVSYATLKTIVKEYGNSKKNAMGEADRALAAALKDNVFKRLNGEKPSDISAALASLQESVREEMLTSIRNNLAFPGRP